MIGIFRKTYDPLVVVVDEIRWASYGDLTPRSIMLYKLLEQQGGIDRSVPPGTYHLNARRRGFKMILSLDPVDE